MNSISISSHNNYFSICAHPHHQLSNPADKARHDRMVTLVTQMLESISDLKARNGFREELIRVLRWLNNSGLLPLMEKTALRRNRPISSRKLQDAKMEHERTVLFFLTLLPQHYLLGLEMAQRPEK